MFIGGSAKRSRLANTMHSTEVYRTMQALGDHVVPKDPQQFGILENFKRATEIHLRISLSHDTSRLALIYRQRG